MGVKSATTFQQQVDLIKRHFPIDNEEQCISFLNHANYYRLSAYFLPFKNSDGTYLPNISFQQIQQIYQFDSHIRAIIFQAIEQIEFYLRTQLAYYIGHTYGALGYRQSENFSTRHNAEKFKQKLEQCIEENSTTLVVKHHQQKYNGNFPIWVIIEFFSMGMLSYLYSDMKTADQKALAKNSFSTSVPCITSWLRCLTDLRNRCAHYSRLYFWSFSAIPKMPKDSPHTANNKLFSQLIMLKYLYPDKAHWNNYYLLQFSALMEQYQTAISLEHIGFPENWEELLKA